MDFWLPWPNDDDDGQEARRSFWKRLNRSLQRCVINFGKYLFRKRSQTSSAIREYFLYVSHAEDLSSETIPPEADDVTKTKVFPMCDDCSSSFFFHANARDIPRGIFPVARRPPQHPSWRSVRSLRTFLYDFLKWEASLEPNSGGFCGA